ncbi:MAG: GntR family transcriptional regulator [Anaerolineae bacterium]|nr:MAG: GntR family transcriptional regulator [Anaerolineae bacterium]
MKSIREGVVGPGDSLPSERELEQMCGVSQITVRRALSELASEGYISRRPGLGTFVKKAKIVHPPGQPHGFLENLAAQGYDVAMKVIEFDKRLPPRRVASVLNIGLDIPILYLRWLGYAEGEPLVLTTCYLNLGDEVTITREEAAGGFIYRLLKAKYGITLHRIEKTIEATGALEDEAQLLLVQPGAPMLLVIMLDVDDEGRLVSARRALYRGDRYKYREAFPP